MCTCGNHSNSLIEKIGNMCTNAAKDAYRGQRSAWLKRVIFASADSDRNTSLRSVRIFSDVCFVHAATLLVTYIKCFLTFLSYLWVHIATDHHSRVSAMFCVMLPTWPYTNTSLINVRCHTRQPRLCVVCVSSETSMSSEFVKMYIYLIAMISLLGTFTRREEGR